MPSRGRSARGAFAGQAARWIGGLAMGDHITRMGVMERPPASTGPRLEAIVQNEAAPRRRFVLEADDGPQNPVKTTTA